MKAISNFTDIIVKENLKRVLTEGKTEAGSSVRPKWKDGLPAYSLKTFGVVNQYDLQKSFPISTLRPTAWKSGLKEIMWIYNDASNDVDLLERKYGVKYWRSWANSEGNLGLAYGRQMQYEHRYKEGYFKQIERLIWDLKKNPYSRRMITNLYNHQDLFEMTLYPCAFLTMWDYDGEYLNMTLVQRSSDYLVAGNINVTQYALLQHMIAQSVGYKVGKFHHYINNLHIYDRHVNVAKEIVSRESKDTPRLIIDDSIRNFYDFKPEHFSLEGYNPHEQITLEVAV
ncbi:MULTISPECIES: thymidylate synthase [Bacillus]|nr:MULTISPECIES: thymidylate synthase [Bacillus]AUG36023.1 thymidylate synthase [Bacillus velezensis]KAF1274285.1 thymidylate synthase [Bacillus amyloliquefaciens]MBT9285823.1 thymidylate synthase [Bacillus velezensis]MCK6102194.1 thymidylate synthase [Bacillus velezensis]MCK6203243.1 thymidylate synthase [Bacillus velezensis]